MCLYSDPNIHTIFKGKCNLCIPDWQIFITVLLSATLIGSRPKKSAENEHKDSFCTPAH